MNQRPTIRLATVDDGAAVAAIYGPYCESSAISFETAAPSADEMAGRIRAIGAERPWLVLEDGGTIAGYAYAAPHHERAAYRWTVSTAVYVGSAYHRRGAGRALYATLFELVRRLGYFRATAGITLPNAASVGLHEAFGFVLVGVYRDVGFKLGSWHDVAWYQATVQPLTSAPAAPRPIAALKGAPEWNATLVTGLTHYGHHS